VSGGVVGIADLRPRGEFLPGYASSGFAARGMARLAAFCAATNSTSAIRRHPNRFQPSSSSQKSADIGETLSRRIRLPRAELAAKPEVCIVRYDFIAQLDCS